MESESRKMKSSTDLSIAIQEDLSEAIPSCLSAGVSFLVLVPTSFHTLSQVNSSEDFSWS